MKPISLRAICLCLVVAFPSLAGVNQWTPIGPLPQGGGVLTIDPSNAENLWVLTGGLRNVWRSRDGGVSWDVITDSTLGSALAIYQVEVDPHDSRHIFALGALGFCVSFDGGDTWVLHRVGTTTLFDGIRQFEVASNGTTIYAPEAQACSRQGGGLFGSPAGCSGGGFWRSTNGGITWTLLSLKNQTVGQIVVDPFNADTVYAIVYQASTTNLGVGVLMRSRDGGRNWTSLSPHANTDGSHSASDAYLVVEKTNSSTLYFAGSDGLLVSRDGGATWKTAISFAGSDALLVSHEGGETWKIPNFPLPVPDPFDSGVLYANVGNEVLPAPAPPALPPPPGLPAVPPPPIPVPPPPNRAYGVVQSSDYGQTWSPLISTSSGNLLIDSRRSFYGVSSNALFRYTLVLPRRRSVKG